MVTLLLMGYVQNSRIVAQIVKVVQTISHVLFARPAIFCIRVELQLFAIALARMGLIPMSIIHAENVISGVKFVTLPTLAPVANRDSCYFMGSAYKIALLVITQMFRQIK